MTGHTQHAPPFDRDSEIALLSALVLDPSNMDKVSGLVSPADFGDVDLGRLYWALALIHDAGLPIGDPHVLVPELKRLRVPEAVREPGFIAALIGRGVPFHATFYAKQIRCCEILRRQYRMGCELMEMATRPVADHAAIGQWLDSQLCNIGERVDDPPRRLGDLAEEFLEELRRRDQAATPGVMTGIYVADETVGGWQPGELIVLAARPGVGKSAFASQVSLHAARRDRSVLFVSLEMTGRELANRVLCGAARVDSRRVRAGLVQAKHLEQLQAAAEGSKGLPVRI